VIALLLPAVIIAAAVVALAIFFARKLLGSAATFTHENGTVLRVDGQVTTDTQRQAILSYLQAFEKDPADPAVVRGLQELGFTVQRIGRPHAES
jgi:hypothetical protein